MTQKDCITLREFVEKYMSDQCQLCEATIKEAIKAQRLQENDLVYVLYVYCCGVGEFVPCPIPIKCPDELYAILYDSICYNNCRKVWYCVTNMLNKKEACHTVETDVEKKIRKIEYASSKEEAVEILKKFGLSEEIARKLIQEVQ